MIQTKLSSEEIRSLKDLANPGLLRAMPSDELKAKFAALGYAERKDRHYAITQKGRRVLWDLAGRRGD
jgi:hypothetical protein